MIRFIVCWLLLSALALAEGGLPVWLDGRKLGAVEARQVSGEYQLPLLAVAQMLNLRISLNSHAGTASAQGREFPITMLNDAPFIAQSQVYPLFGVEVHQYADRIELYSPGYQPPAQAEWRGTGESVPMEVRRFEPFLENNRLVVKARVAPSRRFSSSSGRVRVLLRSADGTPYASFVSNSQRLNEDEEADLIVATWLSEGVSVNPDRSLSVKDYEFRGMPPTTRLLTVEASAEP